MTNETEDAINVDNIRSIVIQCVDGCYRVIATGIYGGICFELAEFNEKDPVKTQKIEPERMLDFINALAKITGN